MVAPVGEQTVTSPEVSLASAVAERIAENFGRWLRFVGHTDGCPIELQVIDVPANYPKSRFAHALTAEDAVRLLDEAEKWKAPGVFTIVNDIDAAIATRDVAGKWHDAKKGASTTDRDVRSRAALFIDVDAKRVRGTSATDEEVERTAEIAERVHAKLAEHLGVEALGYGHSGNGRAVFVALDHLLETKELEDTIKEILTMLARIFAAPRVEIDPVVTDAKRLGPAWGTTKRKGAPGIAERPHRRTGFVCSPPVRRLTLAELQELARRLRAELPADEPRVDVERPKSLQKSATRLPEGPFGRANATPIEEVAAWLGLVDGDGPTCPGCGAHGDSSVAFVANGLKCSHASCARKGSPNRPGFRTPVDLVIEKRAVDVRQGVELLAERFGFEGFPARSEKSSEATPLPEVPGVWARDLGDLCTAPPPRSWFLTDVRTGLGVLLREKVFLVPGDGGVGKGFVLMQMAVCTALGLDLFDTFRPNHPGHVALFVAEDDAEECRHRLWRICNALHLDRDQRQRVGERLKFFPLLGVDVNLLELDRQGNVHRTPLFDGIVAKLTSDATEGGFEWRFLAFDPLVDFAGANAEAHNEIATKFMRSLAAISNAIPGKPAIACAHHESKEGRSSARANSRGVTGLRNGGRAEIGLKAFETDGLRGVRLENNKNNCARHAADVWLVRMENEQMLDGRWLETAGALRLATDDEREALEAVAGVKAGDPEARRKERETKREDAKIQKAQARRAAVLQCLPIEPAHMTTAEVEDAMERAGIARVNTGTSGELGKLRDLGLLKDLGKGNRRMWCRPMESS